MEVMTCFNSLASKEENKLILSDCNIIKTLLYILQLTTAPEKVVGKGYGLTNVKEMAAKVHQFDFLYYFYLLLDVVVLGI